MAGITSVITLNQIKSIPGGIYDYNIDYKVFNFTEQYKSLQSAVLKVEHLRSGWFNGVYTPYKTKVSLTAKSDLADFDYYMIIDDYLDEDREVTYSDWINCNDSRVYLEDVLPSESVYTLSQLFGLKDGKYSIRGGYTTQSNLGLVGADGLLLDSLILTVKHYGNGYVLLDAAGTEYKDKSYKVRAYFRTSSESISNANWYTYDGLPLSLRRHGGTQKRPALNENFVSFQFFDTTLNKAIWWNGTEWVEGDNQAAGIKRAGTWSQRPNADGSFLDNGFQYFLLESEPDEDPDGNPMESITGNGKPIWWIQDSRKWVDATGATVTG
jgi:hypothetical protein